MAPRSGVSWARTTLGDRENETAISMISVTSFIGASLLVVCATLLTACTTHRPPDMFYGEGGYGSERQRDGVPLSMDSAQALIGQRYYIGGPIGDMGSITIEGIDVAGACNTIDYAIVLGPTAPHTPFVASKKP